jgi:hypothetical protein
VVAVGLVRRSFAWRLQLIVSCHHLLLQRGRLVLEKSSSGSEEWGSVSPSLVNRTTRVRKTTSVSYQMSLVRPSSGSLFQGGFRAGWHFPVFEQTQSSLRPRLVERVGVNGSHTSKDAFPSPAASSSYPDTPAAVSATVSAPANSRRNLARTSLPSNLRRLVLVARCSISAKRWGRSARRSCPVST